MPSTPDLTLLKPGARVKLRGDTKPQPAKPYPRGWKTVAEVTPVSWGGGSWDHEGHTSGSVLVIRVESDLRWLPVSLVEEIAP